MAFLNFTDWAKIAFLYSPERPRIYDDTAYDFGLLFLAFIFCLARTVIVFFCG